MPQPKDRPVTPSYYTTHQVAKFLSVSIPTVVNWINSGLLSAHRTPGGHRRISRNDIVSFARAYEYPITADLLSDGASARRVLVVDDENDFSEIVSDYLTIKGGFEVRTAGSGFEAGLVVARFHPDLIILDIMMPDMDGFEVASMLRADPEMRHVPIIACTAYNDRETDRRVEMMGFDDYIQKPLKLDQLLEMIRSHVGTQTVEA
jgi:excisionase family DNA binding protein